MGLIILWNIPSFGLDVGNILHNIVSPTKLLDLNNVMSMRISTIMIVQGHTISNHSELAFEVHILS